ncbi:hypothetical protein HIM_02321 [Hirsutella minnesotensis 3608]|nr:hypothetical protein HIM_02321 [Hirsutella minnesotensis 3608]
MAAPSPTSDGHVSRATFGLPSPRYSRSRTQSVSSEGPSTAGRSLGLLSPPLVVSPAPEFIATTAATQIVTNDHDSHADTWYDQNGIEPPTETAVVTPAAMQLVNAFLDQLLFNILQVSGSTALSTLRPALTEILKPKLAKDTIANADEELREYLGSGDEDEFFGPVTDAKSRRDWDVELAWKRTRLRCMVYSSLGDMEEEDEDIYMEQENLEPGVYEHASDMISPAAAIFLTSVLEYLGELTLTVAGQAACNRMRANIKKDLKDGIRNPSDSTDRIVVGEMDMERVALDRTLGRLWRGWKKRMRQSGIDVVAYPFAADLGSRSRRESTATESPLGIRDNGYDLRRIQESAEFAKQEEVDPSAIPLPMGPKDVDEIEVPGLVHHSDDEDEGDLADKLVHNISSRPKSLVIRLPLMANGLPTPTTSQPHSPTIPALKRSNSLPTPSVSPFFLPKKTFKTEIAPQVEDVGLPQESPPASGITHISQLARSPSASQALLIRHHDEEVCVKAAPESPAGFRRASTASAREEDDHVTYETAEVVTSSRVSIAGSAHSASVASEIGKAPTLDRSSSVRSARIVDVPAHRSPAHSRHTSFETPRRISPFGLKNSRTVVDADPMTKNFDQELDTPGYASSNASIERKRPLKPATASISESEEDYKGKSQTHTVSNVGALATAASITANSDPRLTAGSRRERSIVGPPGDASFLPQQEPPKTRSKAANVKALQVSTGPFRDEAAVETPQKSAGPSGWHSPKADGRGMTPIERTKTKETDDDSALPLQSNVTPRQIHTSASSASSGTSRLKPVRTSEDNSSRAESVARNFEELIQSNQTITYTLTPENMRDIDSKRSMDSPVVTKISRKSEDNRGHHTPRSSPTAADAPRSPLSHHPVKPTSPALPEAIVTKPVHTVPRVPVGSASATSRPGGPQARDARTRGESTADFAEFIKCTGPAGDKHSSPPRKIRPHTSPIRTTMDTYPPPMALNRERYQPREAVIDSRGDSSDLIDFIRQGPPIAASNHRIPRHVAPFRSTMDSDQLNAAVGGMAIDATIPEIRYSQGSTSMTEHSMPSMYQASINSNSALLNKGSMGPNPSFDDERPMPQRKQRRVRDPYAIDYSDDDEDDDLLDAPRPPPKKEESLAEFLRNYEPPPEPPSEPQRLPRKKASAPSLIGRLTRSGTRENRETAGPTSPLKTPALRQDARSLNSRASAGTGRGGYIPIQVNIPSGYDMYGSADNIPAARPRKASTPSTAGRVTMKKFEPREAVVNKGETSDLAAFLRDSIPPDSGVRHTASRNPPRQEDSNGLSKMFGRKKKAGAA